MYAYFRFWDADRAMLLYPGASIENKFKPYLTDDYYKVDLDIHNTIKHQCKMGFVSVLKNGELKNDLEIEILNLLEIN